MDRALLERLLGAVVLVLLFVVFVPALLDGRSDDGDGFQPVRDGERSELILLQDGETRAERESVPMPEPTPLPAAEPLPPPPPPPPPVPAEPAARPAAEAPSAGFAVQLGSFSNRKNAVGFAGSVQSSGYPVFVVKGAAAAGEVYRVYAGPKETRADAEQLAARLAREGQSVMVIDLGARDE
jgi:DedD protein